MLRLFCALTVAVSLPSIGETIFKCPDANGRLNLSDIPCGDGTQIITVRPNVISNTATSATPSRSATPGVDTQKSLITGEVQFNRDYALRKYREAARVVDTLKAALDNNSADKAAENFAVLAEQQDCRRRGISTRRCQDVNAIFQGDIDHKYHQAWMNTHKQFTVALKERSDAADELVRLKVSIPRD